MQRIDYTKIIYGFMAVAILMVTVGSIGSWAMTRIRASFITVHDVVITGGDRVVADTENSFVINFSRQALGTIGFLSLAGFLAAIWLGILVARHERQNDEFKDQLISIASHQLKGPITINRGYLELLETSGVFDQKQKDIFAELNHNTVNMTRVIGNLLDLSRIDLGKFRLERKVVSLNSLVSGIIKELDLLAKAKNIKLVYQAPAEEMPSFLDEEKITQAIKNIIENGIKYSYENTNIEIELRKESGLAVLSIKNQGMGIPKEDQVKIFQKFYRASNTAGKEAGSGLGLFIVKTIIEQSGGTMSFESEENKETTFFVRLPIKNNA